MILMSILRDSMNQAAEEFHFSIFPLLCIYAYRELLYFLPTGNKLEWS